MEYRVERLDLTREVEGSDGYGGTAHYTDLDPEGLTTRLNEIAAEGWRLVAVERVVLDVAKGERLFIFERTR